jgi:hypothetical protein
MVKNGIYRGVEKLKFTKIVALTNISRWKSGVNWTIINPKDTELLGLNIPAAVNTSDVTAIGKCKYVDNTGAVFDVVGKYTSGVSDFIVFVANGAEVQVGGTGYLIYEDSILSDSTSVSGEFTQTDVIGDPANILATPALKDGWLGSWIPVIPDGTGKSFPFVRKSLDTSVGSIYTTDNLTWLNATRNIDNTSNSYTYYAESIRVDMFTYTAFAKQTKVANNATVLNGEAGVGSVMSSGSSNIQAGTLLGESLYGKVSIGGGVSDYLRIHKLTNLTLTSDGKLSLGGGESAQKHSGVILYDASVASSPAFKALSYQVNSNQQLSTNYAYEELAYGVNWGDDGKIAINSGQTTNTDDNGNTVLTGTNTLAIPYGWSKNNT